MHDSWVELKVVNPFAEIVDYFPGGFPVRDPFPMQNCEIEETREMKPLWAIDLDRLTMQQIDLIACIIARDCDCEKWLVLAEAATDNTFTISNDYIENISCGAEGTIRLMEMRGFIYESRLHQDSDSISTFISQQFEKWINTDPEIPNIFIPEFSIITVNSRDLNF